MNSIKLIYPLPHKCLFPNNRPRSHGYFAALVKMRRGMVKYDTIMQIRNMGLPDDLEWKHVTVSISWYAKTLKFPDADNALSALKSTIDGITDSGLIDDDRHLSYEPIVFHKDKERPRVEITLTEGE